jgi:putative ABC transport system substrate-binding protein
MEMLLRVAFCPLGFVLTTFLLIFAQPVYADVDRRIPRIGLAIPVDPVIDVPYNTALRAGLRELGYVDGENIILIPRYANGDFTKYPAVIQELIALDVDILSGEAAALREATKTIPIVSATMDDSVREGLVASLSRPGGNVTGLSAQAFDLWPKHLELTRELLPNLKHLCVLLDKDQHNSRSGPEAPTNAAQFEALARSFGVNVNSFPVDSLNELEAALNEIRKECSEALIIRSSPITTQYFHTIMDSVGQRLPVVSDGKLSAAAGTLLSYSVDYLYNFKRQAVYMDKILKGANPGDLPIEQPTRFKLVVNLKTARALGLTLPQSIMVHTDEVIQ